MKPSPRLSGPSGGMDNKKNQILFRHRPHEANPFFRNKDRLRRGRSEEMIDHHLHLKPDDAEMRSDQFHLIPGEGGVMSDLLSLPIKKDGAEGPFGLRDDSLENLLKYHPLTENRSA